MGAVVGCGWRGRGLQQCWLQVSIFTVLSGAVETSPGPTNKQQNASC